MTASTPPVPPSEPTLFLLDSWRRAGGELRTARLVHALLEHGHPVHLGCLNPPLTLQAEFRPELPRLCLHRRGKWSPAAAWRLRHYVRRHDITRLVCVGLYPMLYAFTANGRHGYDVVVNLNAADTRRLRTQMRVYAPLLRMARHVVFGSHEQRNRWVADHGLGADRCRVIYNGVDTRHFAPEQAGDAAAFRARLGIGDNDVLVGIVANQRPWKNLPLLVDAVAALARRGLGVQLVVAGELPRQEELLQRAASAGFTGLHLLGAVTDVRPLLGAIDVFTLVSRSETFSNAALEAMAMGKPVVLSRVGGLPEMVRHGDSGLLFESERQDDLEAVLQSLIVDAGLRQRLGAAARRAACLTFSIEQMTSAYEQLLERPPSSG